jgi:hypothetical protein
MSTPRNQWVYRCPKLMALKCLPLVAEDLQELVLKNAGKRKESDFHPGSERPSLPVMHKLDLMQLNLMFTSMDCIPFAKKLDVQTYTTVGEGELPLS